MFNNIKNTAISIIILSITLTGCTLPTLTKKEPSITEPEGIAPIISPSANVANRYYEGILPYTPSETRGLLNGSSFDSGRFELGLLEVAPKFFPQGDFLFQEGQHVKYEEARSWVREKNDDNKDGLNTKEKFLHLIVEHDYMRNNKEDPSLGGMVVGLAVAFDYEYTVKDEQGNTTTYKKKFTEEELDKKTKELVNRVSERMRKKVDVPILIAIYGFELNNSAIPGRMLGVGLVEKGKETITEWSPFQERYILLPSTVTGIDDDQTMINKFNDFKKEVDGFFPEFTSVVGLGRIFDDKLKELTITVRADYDSKTQIVQLTQFLGATVEDYFDENAYIKIYVESIERPQAIYVRPEDGKPYMHIYRD